MISLKNIIVTILIFVLVNFVVEAVFTRLRIPEILAANSSQTEVSLVIYPAVEIPAEESFDQKITFMSETSYLGMVIQAIKDFAATVKSIFD